MNGIPSPDDDRGLSEVVGVILLFGLVTAGMALVLMSGSAAKDEVSERNRLASAEQSMQELDSKLGSLAAGSDADPVRRLQVTSRDSESVRVARRGQLSLQIDGRTDCTASVPMDGVVYELESGQTLTYQAGGLFRHGPEGQATMVSPPSVSFQEGVLRFSLVDVAGGFEAGTGSFSARKLSEASVERTQAFREELFGRPDCHRPDTLELTVDTRFADAWEEYFREQMPDSADVETGTRSVSLELDDGELPEMADDDRNEVVNFSTEEPSTVLDESAGELVVDKPDDSNSYDASVQVLGSYVGYTDVHTETERQEANVTVNEFVNESVEVTRCDTTTETVEREVTVETPDGPVTKTLSVERTVGENVTVERNVTIGPDVAEGESVEKTVESEYCAPTSESVTRTVTVEGGDTRRVPVNETNGKPLDVTFVLDKTGSMGQPISGGYQSTGQSKLDAAKDATRSFLSVMPDDAGQRAGLVTYHWAPEDTGEDDCSFLIFGCADVYELVDGSPATLQQGLTTDQDAVNRSVESVVSGASTNIGNGLDRAVEHFEREGSTDRNEVVVLLSDGKETADDWSDDDDKTGVEDEYVEPGEAIDRAADGDVTVYSVGFESRPSEVDTGILQSAASRTGGEYHFASSAEELEDVFVEIVRNESFKEVSTTYSAEKTLSVQAVDTTTTEETRTVTREVPVEEVVRGREVEVNHHRVVHQPATATLSVGGMDRPMADGGDPVERALNYRSDPTTTTMDVPDGETVSLDASFWSCSSAGPMADNDLVRTGAENHSGTTYNHTRCGAGTARSPEDADGVEFYVDGESIPDDDTEWWQRDLRSVVPPGLSDGDEFDLASNQVVAVYRYDDGGTVDRNNLVVLYEVGDADADISADWIVDGTISVVEMTPR